MITDYVTWCMDVTTGIPGVFYLAANLLLWMAPVLVPCAIITFFVNRR